MRLKRPVIHHRELMVIHDLCCVIVDFFSGEGIHDFELNYHLDPDVTVKFQNEWLAFHNSDESIFFFDPEHCFSVVSGQDDPLLGWYSPAYGVLQRTNTIQRTLTGPSEDIRFVTLICFQEAHFHKAIQIRKKIMENQCKDILC